MGGVYRPAAAATLTLHLDDCLGSLSAGALVGLQGEPSTAPWIPGGNGWGASGGTEGDPSAMVANVIPKSCTIRRNAQREADEASVVLRYSDFPIDCRLVRQLDIALRMGCIPHDVFGAAMAAGRNPVLDAMFADQRNLRYVGFQDTQGADFSDAGEWVNLAFRDVTSLPIGEPMPHDAWAKIPWGEPIEEVLLGIFETLPAISGFVLDLVDIAPGSVFLQAGLTHTAGKANKTAVRSPTIEKQSYWDLITEITVGMGLLCYSDVRQGELPKDATGATVYLPPHRFVLTRPSTIYDPRPTLPTWHVTAKRDAAGKLGHTVTGPDQTPQFAGKGRKDPRDPTGQALLAVPTIIYGHNIEELHFERRFGAVGVPSIELVCQVGKFKMRARAKGRPILGHGGGVASEQVRVYTVTGYTSQADLQAAAEQMVDEIGRGDVTMRFTTKDMATFGGDNADPDILDLRAGSPICVLFAKQIADGTVSERLAIEAMSQAELFNRLRQRAGMEEQPARELARFLKDPRFGTRAMTTWYMRSAELSLDGDSGFSASGEAVNYFWVKEAQ